MNPTDINYALYKLDILIRDIQDAEQRASAMRVRSILEQERDALTQATDDPAFYAAQELLRLKQWAKESGADALHAALSAAHYSFESHRVGVAGGALCQRALVLADLLAESKDRVAQQEVLREVERSLRKLAFADLPKASTDDLVMIAIDRQIDAVGEVSKALARHIAQIVPMLLKHESVGRALLNVRIWGAWCPLSKDAPSQAWVRWALDGQLLLVRPNGARQRWIWSGPGVEGEADTILDAANAVDADALAKGHVLLGGPFVTPARAEPVSGGGGAGNGTRSLSEPFGGEAPGIFPFGIPELPDADPQPDASWLTYIPRRLVKGQGYGGLVFEGEEPVSDRIDGIGSTAVLVSWLQRRGALVSADQLQSPSGRFVRIVSSIDIVGTRSRP